MRVEWKLHVRPQLYRYDSRGQAIGKPIDLSPYDHAGLHRLFSSHYQRDETVEAPGLAVRTWRRLFGWAYGISTMEATVLFVCAGAVVFVAMYALCFRYTQMCDSLQDL